MASVLRLYWRALRAPLVVGFMYFFIKSSYIHINATIQAKGSRHALTSEEQRTVDHKRIDTQPAAEPPIVVLFAYMRGGSSFLGGTLEINPDVFYWYEPLWDFYNAMTSSGMFQYPLHVVLDEHEKLRNISEYETTFLRQQLRNLLTCKFREMPAEALSSWTLGKSPQSLEEYIKCMKEYHAVDIAWYGCQKKMHNENVCPNVALAAIKNDCHLYMEQTRKLYGYDIPGKSFPKLVDYRKCMAPVVAGIGNCVSKIETSCQSSKFRGAKILRARMSFMGELLKEFPNIKLIHQLRDPRGTVTSRKSNSRLFKKDIVNEAKLLCKKMVDDIRTRQELEKAYPGAILTTQYEALASHPIPTLEHIYQHLRMPVTDTVRQWLIDATSAKQDGGGFHLSRKNSAATARAWTSKLTAGEKLKIDEVCLDAYMLAGYTV